MSCSKCEQNKPIVNKKYSLCDDCNFMRTHNGQSKQEVYSARSNAKPKKIYHLKPSSKPIKQQTSKQRVIASELSRVKMEIELEAIQNDEYYCWGCGHAKGGLDKSHILSVGQFKHLELIKANINLFCRSCHNIWENEPIENKGELLTFEKDLVFIKEHSTTYFNMFTGAMQDYIQWNPDKNISKKFQNILGKLLPGI